MDVIRTPLTEGPSQQAPTRRELISQLIDARLRLEKLKGENEKLRTTLEELRQDKIVLRERNRILLKDLDRVKKQHNSHLSNEEWEAVREMRGC